jgi:hypothetical protein
MFLLRALALYPMEHLVVADIGDKGQPVRYNEGLLSFHRHRYENLNSSFYGEAAIRSDF